MLYVVVAGRVRASPVLVGERSTQTGEFPTVPLGVGASRFFCSFIILITLLAVFSVGLYRKGLPRPRTVCGEMGVARGDYSGYCSVAAVSFGSENYV